MHHELAGISDKNYIIIDYYVKENLVDNMIYQVIVIVSNLYDVRRVMLSLVTVSIPTKL